MTRHPRTPHTQLLLDKAARLLPSAVRGVTSNPDQAFVVAEAHGSRIVDTNRNEYVDYLMGSGAILLGHAHPAVSSAVAAAAGNGSGYLVLNEHAIELAEEIVRAVPCAERVSFHSTGSDATFFALRLARAYRRRDKVLKFEGGFHGMSDAALMSNQWTRTLADYPSAVPNSAGIPASARGDVLIAPYNDVEAVTWLIERRHDELAAVIIEPMQRTMPPVAGFLESVREVTLRHGIPLVFDEVVTGFRLAYGGAQERYGVVPDLCAIGKSISAGHPISAVCGRADIMDHVEPSARTAYGYVAQTGTYSGNPVSCAAAMAVMNELGRGGVYERLYSVGTRLMEGLRRALWSAGIAAQVTGEPPAFEVWFGEEPVRDFRSSLKADVAAHERFTELLFECGILKAHEKFFVSLSHSDEDVEKTIAAFREVAGNLGRKG
jgi:glutamate-1-semialdehyde 2,1-aminomutase